VSLLSLKGTRLPRLSASIQLPNALIDLLIVADSFSLCELWAVAPPPTLRMRSLPATNKYHHYCKE
jgi:hypothetical protein